MSCQRTGCPQAATHALKLVIPDLTTDRTACECVIGLELCAHHIERAKAEDFLGADSALRKMLAMGAANGTEPDFPEAYCEGVPLGSPEHRAYMGLNDPKLN